MDNIIELPATRQRAPTPVNGKVPARRRRNAEVRSREYLTRDEVERLMDAAGKQGRHRHRDRTLILIAFRHALRASELVALRWDQVDLKQGLLHVTRAKNGSAQHPPPERPGDSRSAASLPRLPRYALRLRDRAKGAADHIDGPQAYRQGWRVGWA